MRLIDAEQCPCNDCVPPLGDSRGCSIFPCREFGEWYANTIYNVDGVVEELEKYGDKFSSENYDDWYAAGVVSDCEEIVKRGGIDD